MPHRATEAGRAAIRRRIEAILVALDGKLYLNEAEVARRLGKIEIHTLGALLRHLQNGGLLLSIPGIGQTSTQSIVKCLEYLGLVMTEEYRARLLELDR